MSGEMRMSGGEMRNSALKNFVQTFLKESKSIKQKRNSTSELSIKSCDSGQDVLCCEVKGNIQKSL